MLRGSVPEVLTVFDGADPSLIVGKRDVTTVATQALFLMNNPLIATQAERMARRILQPKGLGSVRPHRPCLPPGSGPPSRRARENFSQPLPG